MQEEITKAGKVVKFKKKTGITCTHMKSTLSAKVQNCYYRQYGCGSCENGRPICSDAGVPVVAGKEGICKGAVSNTVY